MHQGGIMSAVTEKITTFAILEGHQYLNLTTFRRNGTEVTRPIWFAQAGDSLYFITMSGSGKAKHIRNNPDVFVSPCDARGNPLSDERAPGKATIHEKGTETAARANEVLNHKYGIVKRLFGLTFLFRQSDVVWGEIVPANPT